MGDCPPPSRAGVPPCPPHQPTRWSRDPSLLGLRDRGPSNCLKAAGPKRGVKVWERGWVVVGGGGQDQALGDPQTHGRTRGPHPPVPTSPARATCVPRWGSPAPGWHAQGGVGGCAPPGPPQRGLAAVLTTMRGPDSIPLGPTDHHAWILMVSWGPSAPADHHAWCPGVHLLPTDHHAWSPRLPLLLQTTMHGD